MIFKFWNKQELVLENLFLEDVTDDPRLSLVDMTDILNNLYRVDNNIYMVSNDLAFKLANLFRKGKRDALLFKKNKNTLIVVPSRSYVFWNGKSVDPVKYEFNKTEDQIKQELS